MNIVKHINSSTVELLTSEPIAVEGDIFVVGVNVQQKYRFNVGTQCIVQTGVPKPDFFSPGICGYTAETGWGAAPGQELVYDKLLKDYEQGAPIRAERDAKLQASDWTQLPDVPIGPELKEVWAAYRRALRQVTLQPTYPDSVVWPTPPKDL